MYFKQSTREKNSKIFWVLIQQIFLRQVKFCRLRILWKFENHSVSADRSINAKIHLQNS